MRGSRPCPITSIRAYDYCNYGDAEYLNACVDFVPENADAVTKLRK
jgi:hypothetical protein